MVGGNYFFIVNLVEWKRTLKEELFNGAHSLSNDEIFAIVGDDADDDPSFAHYLPELVTPRLCVARYGSGAWEK